MDEQLTKEGIRAVCVKAVVDVSGSIPQDVRDESHFVNDLWMDDLDVVDQQPRRLARQRPDLLQRQGDLAPRGSGRLRRLCLRFHLP
jgi:hypothetical protein